jgi:uncharacterized protein
VTERRAVVAVAVATLAFGAALWLRERVDPWLATATAAVLSGAIAVGALGRARLRTLFAVDARGLAGAVALGGALVLATHLAFRLAAPWLGPHVRGLYASIDTVVPRGAQAAITFGVVVVEELVWRGCAFAGERSRRGAVGAVVLYALPQMTGGEWVMVLAALGLGTVFAIQRMRTGRLLDALVTHAIWSLAIFVVIPLAAPA